MRIDHSGKRARVFDPFRKKLVALTPEEWVRQHLAAYLVQELGYPRSLTQTEASIKRYGFSRRCDIIIYRPDLQPVLLAECKAPDVPLNDETLHQVAVYNGALLAPLMLISNGVEHFCLELDANTGKYQFRESIPLYTP